jgi:hypothetical protein
VILVANFDRVQHPPLVGSEIGKCLRVKAHEKVGLTTDEGGGDGMGVVEMPLV